MFGLFLTTLGITSRVGVIVGGNWNNGSNCGRYVNVNNAASNANTNIGSRSLYIKSLNLLFWEVVQRVLFRASMPLGKNNPIRGIY